MFQQAVRLLIEACQHSASRVLDLLELQSGDQATTSLFDAFDADPERTTLAVVLVLGEEASAWSSHREQVDHAGFLEAAGFVVDVEQTSLESVS